MIFIFYCKNNKNKIKKMSSSSSIFSFNPLNIFNICKIYSFGVNLLCYLFAIIVLGYIGKYVYIISDDDNKNVHASDILENISFWTPDYIVLITGFALTIMIMFLFFILRLFIIVFFSFLQYFFCILPCNIFGCCNNRSDDDNDDEDNIKRKKGMNTHTKNIKYDYSDSDDDNNDNYKDEI